MSVTGMVGRKSCDGLRGGPMGVGIWSVEDCGMRRSDPKTTSRVDRIETGPRTCAMRGQGRSGRPSDDEMGLVAMSATKPSRRSGNRMSHARRCLWSTMFWVEESMGRKGEVEAVAWQAMALREMVNVVEWRISGQWRRMPGVDVRLKEHAELGDVVGMKASSVVGGFLPERWVAYPNVWIEIWIWMNGKRVFSETWVVGVDVEENAKDYVVVHSDDGVKWR